MRWTTTAAGGLLAVLGLAVLVIACATVAGWFDSTAPLAEWLVAAGTLALAFATYMLATGANKEVQLQREQMALGSRPVVYPACTREFALRVAGSGYDTSGNQVLPLKNGGPGLALNVHGACFVRSTDGGPRHSRELHGGTIAAGDTLDARLSDAVPGWGGVEGFVEFDDLADEKWVTHFRFGHGPTNQLVCFHDPPGRVSELGDPRRAIPGHRALARR